MKLKIESLQVLRGLAAWLVVCHHWMQLVHGFRAQSTVGTFFSTHGAFGVDVFFVISGVVMAVSVHQNSQPRVSEFLLNRAIRIYPAYWCWLLISLVTGFFVPVYGTYPVTWQHTLASFSLFPAEHPGIGGVYPLLPVGWTLYYELVFYALIGSLLPVRKVSYGLWVTASIAMILAAGLLPASTPGIGVFCSNWKIREFAAGLVIGAVYCVRPRPAAKAIATAMGITLLAITVLGALRLDRNIPGGRSLILAGCLTVGTLCLERQIATLPFKQIFLNLGQWSYSTYLCHWCILGAYASLAGDVARELFDPVHFASIVLLIAGTSYVSFVAFEQSLMHAIRRRISRDGWAHNRNIADGHESQQVQKSG